MHIVCPVSLLNDTVTSKMTLCQQIADNSQQSAVYSSNRRRKQVTKIPKGVSSLRCTTQERSMYVYLNKKVVPNLAKARAKWLWSVFALSHWDLEEHVVRLPGRFGSGLSQHRIIPLIWSHFAWLHPGRLPVGAQRGRQLDRRSLLLIKWQDAGSVSLWVDPLSLCSLLSPVPCWPLVSKFQASLVLSGGCCPFVFLVVKPGL